MNDNKELVPSDVEKAEWEIVEEPTITFVDCTFEPFTKHHKQYQSQLTDAEYWRKHGYPIEVNKRGLVQWLKSLFI